MDNNLKKFEQFVKESKREKIFLNGYEFWLDREKQVIYDSEDSKNGIHYDISGTYIKATFLTDTEKKQLLRYLLPNG